MPATGRGVGREIRNKIPTKGPHSHRDNNWPRTENSKQHYLPYDRCFILVKFKYLPKPKFEIHQLLRSRQKRSRQAPFPGFPFHRYISQPWDHRRIQTIAFGSQQLLVCPEFLLTPQLSGCVALQLVLITQQFSFQLQTKKLRLGLAQVKNLTQSGRAGIHMQMPAQAHSGRPHCDNPGGRWGEVGWHTVAQGASWTLVRTTGSLLTQQSKSHPASDRTQHGLTRTACDRQEHSQKQCRGPGG